MIRSLLSTTKSIDIAQASGVRRSGITRALSLLMISLALAGSQSVIASSSQAARSVKEVVARGHVVCVDDKGTPTAACVEGAHRFGFQTSDIASKNKLYYFLPADSLTAMFEDTRVRERTLQITGSPAGEDRLEIIKVHSIHDGKLYDLFYFCEVCNITAYAPGPCACCGKEMELKETPVPEP